MKQFVIIGIGRFGSALAERLYELGHEVLAIDNDEAEIQKISDKVTHAVVADATDENVLKSLGVRNFDVGVVSIGSDIESSIITTLTLKDLGLKHVVAKAMNEQHAKVLYKIGADRVVFPERDMGTRVAHNLIATNILDFIELSPDYSIIEFEIMKNWIGHSLKELNLREKYGINVVAIKNTTDKENAIVAPSPDQLLEEGDTLVIIGGNEDLRKLEKKIEWMNDGNDN